jgi:hypothetical protein
MRQSRLLRVGDMAHIPARVLQVFGEGPRQWTENELVALLGTSLPHANTRTKGTSAPGLRIWVCDMVPPQKWPTYGEGREVSSIGIS